VIYGVRHISIAMGSAKTLSLVSIILLSFIVVCTFLIAGFFLGVFLYEPIWEILMWPSIKVRSSLTFDEYTQFTKLILGRLTANYTPTGILLGIIFWWPIAATVMWVGKISGVLHRKMLNKYHLYIQAIFLVTYLITVWLMLPIRGFLIVIFFGFFFYLFLSLVDKSYFKLLVKRQNA
jgi:hypothetical protein